ncbi:hypothetical protein ACFV9W_03495 [Streptomyces sp. NPDC059897]|uniref:hypothetical protein n=1 Tax=Streptomyces sp. NPDC059897 TaxID=3346994 RepID=UPI003649F899
MTDAGNAIDAATQAILTADASDDQAAQAQALHHLAVALKGDDRLDESVLVFHLAARAAQAANVPELATEAGNARTELRQFISQGWRYQDNLPALDVVLRAHDEGATSFALIGPRTERSREPDSRIHLGMQQHAEAVTRERNRELQRRAEEERNGTGVDWMEAPPYAELAVGFIALKVLGPFIETFATKLGEQLGESVGRALGRIRLFRPAGGRRFLGVRVPASQVLTRVELPEDLTEEARLALIDLDPTVEEVRGRLLRWDETSKTWK